MLHKARGYFSIGKKILLVVIVYGFILTAFSNIIVKNRPQTQYNLSQYNREQIYKVINDPQLNKTPEGRWRVNVYKNSACALIGEGCTQNPTDGDANYKKSLIGSITSLMDYPYQHPPASGVFWVKSGLENAGFIPQTYAAEGIGYAAIKAYGNLWKSFRDISYMLLVLIITTIGFMVMFRMKLNPQTVITAENALPRIIISLLLITFSFAIAGFLIDLMYFLIAIIISILGGSPQQPNYDVQEFQKMYINPGFNTLWMSMFPKEGNNPIVGLDGINTLLSLGNSMLAMLGSSLEWTIRTGAGIFGAWYGWQWAPKVFDYLTHGADYISFFGISLGAIPSIIIGLALGALGAPIMGGLFMFLLPQLIIAVLVLFTVLFLLFRIFFLLMRSYLQILILIIFAPIILLFGAIPGKNAFGYWFKALLAEVLVFPTVVTVFLLGYIIVNTIAGQKAYLWTPPFLVDIHPGAFAVLTGMSLIFITPDIVKLMKELLGVKGAPIGLGLGTIFAGAGAGAGGAFGVLSQYGSLAYTVHHLGFGKYLSFLPGFGDMQKSVQSGSAGHGPPH